MYISEIKIENYRSLRDITINNLNKIVVFHGLNNTGKSNILSALEIIFQRKIPPMEDNETQPDEKWFWKGEIQNFTDNFYQNIKENIRFEVKVEFAHGELLKMIGKLPKNIKDHLVKNGHNDRIVIHGEISPKTIDVAEFNITKIILNSNKLELIIFCLKSGQPNYFPSILLKEKGDIFDNFMELFHDCVSIMPSNRNFKSWLNPSLKSMSNSRKFKNWLYDLSMNKLTHDQFYKIKDIFNSPPFSYGEISFAKINNEFEVMIKNGSVRLPIERVGSGLQQILYIIAFIVVSQSKIIGIEELETNLSPTLQKEIFKKLRQYIESTNSLLNQLIITSHSDYFSPKRTDIRVFGVELKNHETQVNKWDKKKVGKFFKKNKAN